VSLEIYCRGRHTIAAQRRKSTEARINYELLVNIYGKAYMFERVGKFFEAAKIYLKDSVCCARDVPYKNPHILAEENGIIMTSSLKSRQQLETFTAPGDIFDHLLLTDCLPEAQTPQALRTTLHRYTTPASYYCVIDR
jgi:SWI/SNF-related matrix-associated actin-dependent regulator of chromatin subfamily A3